MTTCLAQSTCTFGDLESEQQIQACLTAFKADNLRRQKCKHGATPSALASYLLRPKPLLPQPHPPHHRRPQILHLQRATHLPAPRPFLQPPSYLLPQPRPLLRQPYLHQWGTTEPVLTERHGGHYPKTPRKRIEDLHSRLCPSFYYQWQLLSWLSGVFIKCDQGRRPRG